jgi:hypothetical protein
MEEYEDLGHINQINEDGSTIAELYYLPYQAVSKSCSSTTQIHFVFDDACCLSK